MHLVVTSGEGIASAAIRWATWSWASHVAFYLDDGLCLDATPSLGVALHLPTASYRVMQKFAVAGEPAAIEKAVSWATRQIGKPYDWSAIAGFAVRRDWRDPAKWFCSELVATAFEAVGLPLLRTEHLDRITPRDLLLSPLLRRIG